MALETETVLDRRRLRRRLSVWRGLAIVVGLFALGLVFGYLVVLPRALTFLTNYDDNLYDVQIRASYYFSFVSLALLGMALVFELPIFVLALVRLRVLTADRLRRNRRIGMFVVIVIAALLPTVDPVSLAFEEPARETTLRSHRTLQLGRLRPGRYLVEVRVSGPDGTTSTRRREIQVVKGR